MDKTDWYILISLLGIAATLWLWWRVIGEKYSMHEYAAQGEKEFVRDCLKKNNGDVDTGDGYQATALHRAILAGQFGTAEFLLDHGANPGAKDAYGRDAIDFCRAIEPDLIDGEEEAWKKLLARLEQTRQGEV